MENYLITTDSGCDLPLHVLQQHNIIPFMLEYEINGLLYLDTMLTEDSHLFYELMRSGAVPHTSQINVQQFLDFWTPMLTQNTPIVHISLASSISSTYYNAILAKKILQQSHPNVQIFLVDSTLSSVGYGMLVLEAAKLRQAGISAQNCHTWLESHKNRINAWFTTDELKYLRRSDRCSLASAAAGTIPKNSPILNMDAAGHLIVQERVPAQDTIIEHIRALVGKTLMPETADSQTLYICHSDIPEKAHAFGQTLRDAYGFQDVFETCIGTTTGAHCGPGLMAAFYFGSPRTMAGYVPEPSAVAAAS